MLGPCPIIMCALTERYNKDTSLTLLHLPHISISHNDSTDKTVSHYACDDEYGIYCCYDNIS